MALIMSYKYSCAACVAMCALLVSACSGVREIPVTDLRPWKPITASCADTPETRKQIRDHNGVYESLRTKKKVVFRDDCPKQDEKPTS